MNKIQIITVAALFACPTLSISQHIAPQDKVAFQQENVIQVERGHYEAVFERCQQSLPVYEATGDWAGVACCRQGMGYSAFMSSRFDEAKQNLEQGIDITLHKAKNAPPALLPWLYLNFAGLLLTLDTRSEECMGIYNKALQAVRDNRAEDNLVLGYIYYDLALAHQSRRSLRHALEYAQKAANSYPSIGGTDLDIIQATALAAGLYEMLGDKQSSLKYYRDCEERIIRSEKLLHTKIAGELWASMASFFYNQSENDKALEYLIKAIKTYRDWAGDHNYLLVSTHAFAGKIHMAQENWDEAEKNLRQAIAVADSVRHEPYQERISALLKLALTLTYQGRVREGESVMNRCRAEMDQLGYDGNESDVCELAEFYEKTGKNEAAIQYIEQYISRQHTIHSDNPILSSGIYNYLGRLLNKSGQYDKALSYLQKSLDIQQFNLTETAGRDSLPMQNVVQALFEMSGALYYKGRRAETDTILLSQAMNVIQLGIQIMEDERRRYLQRIEQNFSWVAGRYEMYIRAAAIAAEQHRRTADPSYMTAAYQMAAKGKGVALIEGVQSAHAKIASALPDSILLKEAELSANIIFYEKHILAAGNAGNEAITDVYRDKLFKTRREAEKFAAQIEEKYPRYYRLKAKSFAATAESIQEKLSDESLYVEYVLNRSDSLLYVFAIDRVSGLFMGQTPFTTQTYADIQELNALLQNPYIQRHENRLRFIKLSHQLYNQLIAPIREQVSGKRNVIFVLEGVLHHLPFELLLPSGEELPFASLKYFFRRCEISYHYSGALLGRHTNQSGAGWSPQSGNAKDIFAFAPVFDDQAAWQGTAQRNASGLEASLGATSSYAGFSPLNYSEREINDIAHLFGQERMDILLRHSASERMLKAALEHPYRIIHIASHSFANLKHPKFSGIACAAPDSRINNDDGILHVGEIYNLRIPAELVVLSSCESGLGKLTDSEGLLGLNRAFAYAGVPNIVFSLWKVNDKAGSELMVAFYKGILEGQSYGAALRAAKLKMLENPATASPNFWGGFLLMGR